MKILKQTLFTGWSFMRWLRLAVGLFFVIQGIQSHDSLMGLAGGFFLFTAVANAGCCGSGRCTTQVRKYSGREPEEVHFEEIKNK